VCYVVKNSLPWRRGGKTQQKKWVKKQKIPDPTRGGNSNDIAHRSLIRVNTVVMDTIMIENLIGVMLDDDLIERTP